MTETFDVNTTFAIRMTEQQARLVGDILTEVVPHNKDTHDTLVGIAIAIGMGIFPHEYVAGHSALCKDRTVGPHMNCAYCRVIITGNDVHEVVVAYEEHCMDVHL